MGFLDDLELGDVETDPNRLAAGAEYAAVITKSELRKKNDGSNHHIISYTVDGKHHSKDGGKTQEEWFGPLGKPESLPPNVTPMSERQKSFYKRRLLEHLGVPAKIVNGKQEPDLNAPGELVNKKVWLKIVIRDGYQNVASVRVRDTSDAFSAAPTVATDDVDALLGLGGPSTPANDSDLAGL